MKLMLAVLSVLASTLPGASPSDPIEEEPQFPATLRIGPQKMLLYASGEMEIAFETGDEVVVDWKDGVCMINGHIHRPHPEIPPKRHSIDLLRSLYGNVPTVQQYVEDHLSSNTHEDSIQVWNDASRVWGLTLERLSTEISTAYYIAVHEQGIDPDEAAHAAVEALLDNPLVAEAAAKQASLGSTSSSRSATFRPVGALYADGITLWGYQEDVPMQPTDPKMTWSEMMGLWPFMRALEEDSEDFLLIRLRDGNFSFLGGEAALSWRDEWTAKRSAGK